MSVGNLSGGNQQKVALAKWLDAEPAVFIIDEPTRGVDVGAKREIYQVVCDLAAQGLAVLLISSELTEIIGLCHRALVVRDGAVVGELKGDQITEPAMIKLAAGVQAS
jgi:ribose transport system ATP-binding protein